MAIPFNQNQIWLCSSCWQGLNLLLSSLWEFPNGRVLLSFLFYDKVWSNFSLDSFFLFSFLSFFIFVILQDWHRSFLIVRLTSILPLSLPKKDRSFPRPPPDLSSVIYLILFFLSRQNPNQFSKKTEPTTPRQPNQVLVSHSCQI